MRNSADLEAAAQDPSAYRRVRGLLGWALATLLATGSAIGQADSSFLLTFDTQVTAASGGGGFTARLKSGVLLEPDADVIGRYAGIGRLRYTSFQGIPVNTVDGVLDALEMNVSSVDGTVTLRYFPGDPKPFEFVPTGPGFNIQQFNWIGAFLNLHQDELQVGGLIVTGWEYPDNDSVYARKRYERQIPLPEDSGTLSEVTVIELTPVLDPPVIESIEIESAGISVDDPETGEEVTLTAELDTPFPFEVVKCTWIGNNFNGPGNGDPEDKCRWKYTPREGKGPERETYGDKNVNLTVVYDFGQNEDALELDRSKDYKTFFSKKGDDNSNGDPNWFDYWGDDGAVPDLDDSDVDYDGTIDYFAYADGSRVFMGALAAEVDGTLNIPANPNCAGGTFPGASGIDLAALTLAHERRHNEIAGLSGADPDSDGVPTSAEAGTSPTNPDSCSLATVIDPDYATYGDDEYIARRAELGVSGVADNDWAVPGRQATLKTGGAGKNLPASDRHRGAHPLSVRPTSTFQNVNDTLTGSYVSTGLDTDASGDFDALAIDIGVQVAGGDYTAVAWLTDDLDAELAFASNTVTLPAGTHTIRVLFDGPELNRLGETDPLHVGRVVLFQRVGKHAVRRDEALDVHDTTAVSADFDPPVAVIAGVVAEMPVDLDGDTLFNALEITVDLEVNEPGEYRLEAQLGGAGLALVAETTLMGAIGGVTEPVVLAFDGAGIFGNRQDGPWQLEQLRLINVSDESRLETLLDSYATNATDHRAFQRSAVVIDETSYVDSGGATDGEGKFTTLDVQFDIVSEAPGPYQVFAYLEDITGRVLASARQVVALPGAEGSPERFTTTLQFDGASIGAAGIDGPFTLSAVTVLSDAGVLMDQNPKPFLTQPYTASQFPAAANPPPSEPLIFRDSFE